MTSSPAVPPGASAQRPRWPGLPASVRQLVQDHLGAEVLEAHSQGSGFTPGFASRLRLSDGRWVFMKAADPEHDWMRSAYRNEAEKLALLPAVVPAPRLRWVYDGAVDGGDWVILLFDDVAGRSPTRPWDLAEAHHVLRTAAETSAALTPAPEGYRWLTFANEFGAERDNWDLVPRDGFWREHASEAAELTRRALQICTGETLAHCDLRDDNVIIDETGAVWFCDWNFPILGPAWMDTVTLIISMQGDGLDGDSLLAASPVVHPDDHEAIDCFLALLCGYFHRAGAQPEVVNSPHLRTHQRWYADVTTHWLAQRRGWLRRP